MTARDTSTRRGPIRRGTLVALLLLLLTSPGQADPAEEGVRQRLRGVAETYRKWGITFDVKGEQAFSGTTGFMPSYLKVSGGYESVDTVRMNVEAGLGEKQALAVSMVGDYKTDASGQVVTGGGSLYLKGSGLGGRFSYSRADGFQFESGLEETFYSFGVRFGERDKGPLALGLKLGPLKVGVDPVQWARHCREAAPQMAGKVGGVLVQVDLPALASALTDAPLPDSCRLREVTAVSLRRLDPQQRTIPLTTIFGVACDAEGGDVILLGRSEPGASPIPLPVVSAVLRSCWRDGLDPFVSLDPEPDGGALRARLGGLSPGLESSELARLLLDADHHLKEVVNGDTPVAGLQALDTQIAATPGARGGILARFWLAERPFESGDLAVLKGPAGSLYTFDAEPRVLAETLERKAAASSDAMEAIFARTAASFSASLPRLEASHPELGLRSVR